MVASLAGSEMSLVALSLTCRERALRNSLKDPIPTSNVYRRCKVSASEAFIASSRTVCTMSDMSVQLHMRENEIHPHQLESSQGQTPERCPSGTICARVSKPPRTSLRSWIRPSASCLRTNSRNDFALAPASGRSRRYKSHKAGIHQSSRSSGGLGDRVVPHSTLRIGRGKSKPTNPKR